MDKSALETIKTIRLETRTLLENKNTVEAIFLCYSKTGLLYLNGHMTSLKVRFYSVFSFGVKFSNDYCPSLRDHSLMMSCRKRQFLTHPPQSTTCALSLMSWCHKMPYPLPLNAWRHLWMVPYLYGTPSVTSMMAWLQLAPISGSLKLSRSSSKATVKAVSKKR